MPTSLIEVMKRMLAVDLCAIEYLDECLAFLENFPFSCILSSLIAQLVKNLPAMWETWVRSLDWKDPLEKAKATQTSILAWRIAWTV